MNAKELAESLKQAAQRYSVRDMEVMAILYAASLEASKLVPAYRPPQPSDSNKYCFLEELPADAPPTLVYLLGRWHYWTVAGWRELTKGVWPCERPE